mmetsp:Transcript_36639/g.92121  ORF Transcript_36639/g.92121 Transcript_36639/m.92121 type:complete len:206 (+) Transcript_36639:247-864(+)
MVEPSWRSYVVVAWKGEWCAMVLAHDSSAANRKAGESKKSSQGLACASVSTYSTKRRPSMCHWLPFHQCAPPGVPNSRPHAPSAHRVVVRTALDDRVGLLGCRAGASCVGMMETARGSRLDAAPAACALTSISCRLSLRKHSMVAGGLTGSAPPAMGTAISQEVSAATAARSAASSARTMPKLPYAERSWLLKCTLRTVPYFPCR